jgi:hypothetical protein
VDSPPPPSARYQGTGKVPTRYEEWNGDFKNEFSLSLHVNWVPCHHGMARHRVADTGVGLQIWRVAANILNKQSRTADRGWPSSLGVGRGAKNPPPVKHLLRSMYNGLGI